MNPGIYGKIIYNKGAKTVQWEMDKQVMPRYLWVKE